MYTTVKPKYKNTKTAMQICPRRKKKGKSLSCIPLLYPPSNRPDADVETIANSDSKVALDSELRDIDRSSRVEVAIKIDESVPSVERKGLARVSGVLDLAADVVASSTGSDGLERVGDDLGAECVTEEVAEGHGVAVDGDVAVGVFAALVVGELHGEDYGCGARGGGSCESGGEESGGGCEDD
jgi:hypothetical protein